jgi:long-subunit fatty acid transport protein
MIKKIIASTCLLLTLVSFAQDGTSSPYSFYGIGDVRFKGTVESRSMAGIAIETDSIHINLQNPAGFSNLKLTTFTIGGTYKTTKLKTSNENASARRTTLDYLAIGLPLGKLGFGFGLIPFTSVGYKIQVVATDVTQNSKRFNGTGGLNKAFLGFGYKLAKNLSVGLDAQYNFGKIETNNLEFRPFVPIGSRELNTAELSGINFDLGLMYQSKVNKKTTFYSSLTYSPESTLVSQNTRNISTVRFNSSFDIQIVDELENQKNSTNLKLPSKLSIGAGFGENKKWLLGAEITLQNEGGLANNYNAIANATYEKATKFSLGGYFLPNYNSFTSYAKRIVYRGGLKYEKTGLIINSESINDIGLTLGVGLPLTGSFSNVNIGFELGKKGTTAANLVQENYANLSVSFSFNDKWFVKRKFY